MRAKSVVMSKPNIERRTTNIIGTIGSNGMAGMRGLASNLYDLGLPDLLIQRILRHSDVNTTRKSCIKVREPKVTAGMAQLEAEIRKTETVQ
jgi:hypothetical protein